MSTDTDAVPIVFVHGWAGSAQSWTPVTARLGADRAIGPTVCVPLPGSPASGVGQECTVPGAAAAVVAALHELNRPAVLVGHSMGAQVTLLAQVEVPELVLGEIVIDPAYASTDSVASMQEWAAEIDRRGHAALTSFFESAMGSRMSAVSAAQIRADLAQTSAAALASYLRSEYVDRGSIGLVEHTVTAAARRTRPVLAVHSSQRGADAESLLAAPVGSSITTWPGYGHYLHLEAPGLFAETIREWCSSSISVSDEVASS